MDETSLAQLRSYSNMYDIPMPATAADEIERLRKENTALEALFVAAEAVVAAWNDDEDDMFMDGTEVAVENMKAVLDQIVREM